jgi:transaldolase
MKLWIASANVEEIKDVYSAFPVTGVITNPTVIANEHKHWKETLAEVNEIGSEPIHLQLVSTSEKEMLEEMKAFIEIMTKRPVIAKIPLCKDGLKIIPTIKKWGCQVNITTICNLNQAAIALEADVDYLSVYVARVNDRGGDGFKLVEEITNYIRRKGKKTEVIAASVRDLEQMNRVILAGADGIAIPYSLLNEAIEDELTKNSIDRFENDWALVK